MNLKKLFLIIFFITITTNVSADINEGLLAYYPFNGTADDASGNGNDGIVSGAVLTKDRFGNANDAYFFDGNDDFISIGDLTQTGSITNELTVSVWVKPHSLNRYTRFVSRGISGPCKYPYVNVYLGAGDRSQSHTPRFALDLDGENVESPQDIDYFINIDFWHHIVGVYNGTELSMYVNGKKVSTTMSNGTISGSENIFSLGAELDGCTTPEIDKNFYGVMDDVRIYNRALSSSEIEELAEETFSCSPNSGFTQSDIDAAKEQGKEICKNNPSSCGIDTTSSVSVGTGTISSNLDIHVPSLNYTPLFGDKINLQIDFEYVGEDSNNDLLWKLKSFEINQ